MDEAVVVFMVLGAALVVAVGALILYRPEKKDEVPSFSKKQLERLYEDQYGRSPNFASHRDRDGEKDDILHGVGRGLGNVLELLLSGPFIG